MNRGCRARRNGLLATVIAALVIVAPLGAGGTPVASPMVLPAAHSISLVAGVPAGAEIPPAYLRDWGTQGGGNGQFQTITDLAVHPSGVVTVSDQTLDRVQQFDTRDNSTSPWA